MNRPAVALIAILAGCAWSNSLYQARVLSNDAARAERDRVPGGAQTLWGQVIPKAESAYARSPKGLRGAEALWLEGHAEARTNDCLRAVPALEGALFLAPHARWHQELLLELGECDEAIGGPTAASVYAMLIASSTDSSIRRRARIRQGHVLVLQQQWGPALVALNGEDSLPARLDRAEALAQLGHTDQALVDLEPSFAAADDTIRWDRFIAAFASHNSADTDRLLARLVAFPKVREPQKAAWIFAAASDAVDFDPNAAVRRLSELTRRPAGSAVSQGQLLQLQLSLTRAASLAQLSEVLDSVRRAGDLPEGVGFNQVALSQQRAQQLVDRNGATPTGSARGDLAMFALAEFARDTLGAPGVAAWFFARLERDWPQSPYVAKALIARSVLEPDSTAALLGRARLQVGSPYVAATSDDVGGRARLVQLEDSLGQFMRVAWRNRPASPAVQDHE